MNHHALFCHRACQRSDTVHCRREHGAAERRRPSQNYHTYATLLSPDDLLTIRDRVACEQRIYELVLRDTILDHSTLRVSADRDVSKSRHISKVMFHSSALLRRSLSRIIYSHSRPDEVSVGTRSTPKLANRTPCRYQQRGIFLAPPGGGHELQRASHRGRAQPWALRRTHVCARVLDCPEWLRSMRRPQTR